MIYSKEPCDNALCNCQYVSMKGYECAAPHLIFEWTPTAIELWNDKAFLEKRYEEQMQYLKELRKREISKKRFDELRESALSIGIRIVDRLHELEKQEIK